MVSYACSSRLSPGLITAAAPPSAETVWLRMGYTLEMTVTLRLGEVSATAMAARNPAPPPPTTSTSHAKVSIRFFEDQWPASDHERGGPSSRSAEGQND